MNIDQFLFGVFPWVAIVLAVVVSILRFTTNRFSYSSLSSQFLENKRLFAGSVGWHYGLLFLLGGHIVGFLVPSSVLAWNGDPLRLYVLEVSALAAGFLVLWGLFVLIYRRIVDAKVRSVTSWMDVVLLLVLLVQVVAGVWTAVFYRWGSSWYAAVLVPYLRSLLLLSPDTEALAVLPFAVKLHVFGAFLLLALLPFSRLVHFFSIPFSYFQRPYQLVVWYRKREPMS